MLNTKTKEENKTKAKKRKKKLISLYISKSKSVKVSRIIDCFFFLSLQNGHNVQMQRNSDKKSKRKQNNKPHFGL